MNKTKILISTILAITMILPIVLAATPSLFPDFTEIKNALVTIFYNDNYDAGTVETILRIALLVISTAIIHRTLNYTLGEEGTIKAGILTDKLILIISAVAGFVTAILIPFELLMNGITFIFLAFVTYFGLNSLMLVWEEQKGDKEEWKVIATLITSIITLFLFWSLILGQIGEMKIGGIQMPTGTFKFISQYTGWVLLILVVLAAYNIIAYRGKYKPAKTRTEKATEELEEETEKTKIAKVGLKKTAQAKAREAIGNTVDLISALERLNTTLTTTGARQNVQTIQKDINNYLQTYNKFETAEEELINVESANIDTSSIPAKTKKLIQNDESLLDAIKNVNKNLNISLGNILEAKPKDKLTEITAEKKNYTQDIKDIRQLLNAVLKINQEEAEE